MMTFLPDREPTMRLTAPCLFALLSLAVATAESHATETPAPAAGYDAELAKRVGADERGMRQYVLVILKSSATPVADPEQRKAMFAGHFANMERLSSEGKLALAGPFPKNAHGWRGLFVLAVPTVEEAEALTRTDPVIVQGEMVAEFHPWYASAATMLLPELHNRLTPPAPAAAPASPATPEKTD
jgi:uncharacterized protein YciI